MKLYVICKSCDRKIYLSINAEDRKELMNKLGSRRFKVKCPYCSAEHFYDVNEVMAESGTNGAPTLFLALIGAALAEFGGLVAGGIIGTLIEAEERKKAEKFNRVRV